MERTVLIACVILVITVSWGQMCQGNPSYNTRWPFNSVDDDQHVNECDNSNVSRELCQRCAKVTKSRLAYTMCCERRENTREWCVKFMSFGINSASSSTINTNN